MQYCLVWFRVEKQLFTTEKKHMPPSNFFEHATLNWKWKKKKHRRHHERDTQTEKRKDSATEITDKHKISHLVEEKTQANVKKYYWMHEQTSDLTFVHLPFPQQHWD